METIKYTIGLVFQLLFGVAAIGTYFNMLQLPRLEAESKLFAQLVHFIISMGLMIYYNGAFIHEPDPIIRNRFH